MKEEMDERRMYQQIRRRRWERLKLATAITAVIFAVTLAIVVGNRLSEEALSVLVGVVCGVGAAIPTSLIIVAITRRQEVGRQPRSSHPASSSPAYPPIIVVAPPGNQQRNGHWNALPPPFNSPGAPSGRRFTVVGEPPTEDNGYEDDEWL